MAGAVDTEVVTETEILAVARRQRLERTLALFPGEFADAMKLAEDQAAALHELDGPIEQSK